MSFELFSVWVRGFHWVEEEEFLSSFFLLNDTLKLFS